MYNMLLSTPPPKMQLMQIIVNASFLSSRVYLSPLSPACGDPKMIKNKETTLLLLLLPRTGM